MKCQTVLARRGYQHPHTAPSHCPDASMETNCNPTTQHSSPTPPTVRQSINRVPLSDPNFTNGQSVLHHSPVLYSLYNPGGEFLQKDIWAGDLIYKWRVIKFQVTISSTGDVVCQVLHLGNVTCLLLTQRDGPRSWWEQLIVPNYRRLCLTSSQARPVLMISVDSSELVNQCMATVLCILSLSWGRCYEVSDCSSV